MSMQIKLQAQMQTCLTREKKDKYMTFAGKPEQPSGGTCTQQSRMLGEEPTLYPKA